MESYKLEFVTAYHQFYLVDKLSPFRTDSANFWSKQASDDKLAIEEGLIGVGTECYGPVKGELQILDHQPENDDFSSFGHVVEGSIDIQSGILRVVPCLDDEPFLEVGIEPGCYRARVYASNLDTVIGDEGDDYYKIEVWPERYSGRNVLKR